MTTEDWTAIATFVLGAAVAILGLVQWLVEQSQNSRRRDVEMFSWGERSISVFADLEMIFRFPEGERDSIKLRTIMRDSSALIDQGRLFFPNVIVNDPNSSVEPEEVSIRSYRDTVLDELVRAYLLSKSALKNPVFPSSYQGHTRAARRRFVSKLQSAMGKSLRKASTERSGESIPRDPSRW